MKNLFKNLMLVAVAAMAFTACQNDNNEVNEVNRVTRYEFTANIADDTRSGFVEKEEGATAYKSEWHEGDEVKVFIDNYGTVTTGIDTEGNFALELTDAPESFFMTVCSPAEAWTGTMSWTVPTEQTPLANSVDPKAHILRSGDGITVANGTPNQKIVMTHFASYGKMTVNGVDFKINKVEVSFNGGQVYTINATNVENNTFWFAISDILTVSEFTVTAYGDNDSVVTRTVTIPEDRELKFNWGRVSTFSVKDLEVPKVYTEFTAAEMVKEYSTNDVMVSFTGSGLEEMQINFYGAAMVSGSLNVGSFTIGNGLYDGYCFYGDTQLDTITIVSTFENGVYNLVFSNLKDNNGNVVVDRELTYTGLISGLTPVDLRTQLAAPSNITSSVDGKTITLSWDAVEGADGYRVKLYSPHDEYFEEVVTGTEYVYNAQLANTKYSFTIMSYAKDDNTDYRSSDDAYVDVTTEDTDPKMEVSESQLAFSADGGEKTFNVTLKNFTADINVTHGDNEWLTIVPNGNTFTVTAVANDVEEKRYDTIVITAGDFTEQISVEQAAKSAEGGGNEPAPEGTGTESNPYVYACAVEYQSLFGGYYTLTFTCKTEGSFNLYFETMNANLSNFVSASFSDTSKYCSAQITGYTKSWAPDESTIKITKIADKTYSVDIMISTFDGKVYYTCPSVVFP